MHLKRTQGTSKTKIYNQGTKGLNSLLPSNLKNGKLTIFQVLYRTQKNLAFFFSNSLQKTFVKKEGEL